MSIRRKPAKLTLDSSAKNMWGDPMPKIMHRRDAACEARYGATKQHIGKIFERMASNHNGRILRTSEGNYLDHPAGGCRMGTDPAKSVCDSFGRTHDHENLFVVGGADAAFGWLHPNGTLTFVALTLRDQRRRSRRIFDSLFLGRWRGASCRVVFRILRITGNSDFIRGWDRFGALDPCGIGKISEEARAGRQASVDQLSCLGVVAILECAS